MPPGFRDVTAERLDETVTIIGARKPQKAAPKKEPAKSKDHWVTVSTSPLIKFMRDNGVEVTRENYINLNWGTDAPSPWTAADEAELPPELQDWDKVPPPDGQTYHPDDE